MAAPLPHQRFRFSIPEDTCYLNFAYMSALLESARRAGEAAVVLKSTPQAVWSDAEKLLRWALAQDVARVVVKRPARASCLGGIDPSHSIDGKAVRFDVHVLRAIT